MSERELTEPYGRLLERLVEALRERFGDDPVSVVVYDLWLKAKRDGNASLCTLERTRETRIITGKRVSGASLNCSRSSHFGIRWKC